MAAGPGNVVQGGIARQLVESLAARGASPNTPGPMGASPEQTEKSLSQRMAELRGADPGMVMRKLNQIKKDIVELIPQMAFTIPAVSKHLSTLLKSVDGALKEIEQAVNVEQAVGGEGGQGGPGPIDHTAAGAGQGEVPQQGPQMPFNVGGM